MAIEFAIEDSRLDDRTHLVAVTGEIDLFTAPEFKQRLNEPIDAGVSHVVVDLGATTFVDSSSLGVLIGAQRRLAQQEGTLTVACENPAILKTFKITGLDGVFRIVGTVAEARSADAVPTGP